MNILMLGRWLPPPRRSVRSGREYHFGQHLARTHHVTLGFITDNPDSEGTIAALRKEFVDLEFATVPRAWKSLASAVRLAAGESCTLSYFNSTALRTRLRDRLSRQRYDVVLVSSSSMIQYALDVDPAIPLVVDFGEVDSEWWTRQADRAGFGATRFFRTEAVRLREAETAAARRAARCVVATPEAAAIVSGLGAKASPRVIPTGVDMDGLGSPLKAGKTPTVLFSMQAEGEREVREAIAFCRGVIPAIEARVPRVRFSIMTKEPGMGARIAGSLKGVDFAGSKADLRARLHTWTVTAASLGPQAELAGSVLEPMAAGLATVVSAATCQRIGASGGKDVMVADGALDFALQVSKLLQDDSLREEVGTNGRRFVQWSHSWAAFVPLLETVIAEATRVTAGSDRTGTPTTTGISG